MFFFLQNAIVNYQCTLRTYHLRNPKTLWSQKKKNVTYVPRKIFQINSHFIGVQVKIEFCSF